MKQLLIPHETVVIPHETVVNPTWNSC